MAAKKKVRSRLDYLEAMSEATGRYERAKRSESGRLIQGQREINQALKSTLGPRKLKKKAVKKRK